MSLRGNQHRRVVRRNLAPFISIDELGFVVGIGASTDAVEAFAIDVDQGFGIQAMTAVIARPPGPQRAVEIARWAERARVARLRRVAIPLAPLTPAIDGMSIADLAVALKRITRTAA